MGNAIANKALNKGILLEIMTDNLPALRAMIGLSQDDISNIIGISRQTYCASRLTNEKCHGRHLCHCYSCFGTTKKQKC